MRAAHDRASIHSAAAIKSFVRSSAPASAQCICVQNYPGVVMLICMCPVIYLRTNTRARSSIGCRSEHNFWWACGPFIAATPDGKGNGKPPAPSSSSTTFTKRWRDAGTASTVLGWWWWSWRWWWWLLVFAATIFDFFLCVSIFACVVFGAIVQRINADSHTHTHNRRHSG